MQMTLRNRLLDIIPVLLVFAFVAAFATYVAVEHVLADPVTVPPQQGAVADEQPQDAPHGS